ncbi:hypothetical protein [Celeribacter halophilus]|uniref:hypothetical protein n=1 Tax=Celeribacter halophilus TaxID=576117 RepID=UPI001C0948CA|nr:hypothetical protein [Celeribacter halophilus]MBU2888683.1 hypothetical protein [Celeribacter halophilus]MDO6508962.1 hypothetical protein [Celeribacter halophilus]
MTNVTGVPAFGGGGFAFRQPPDPPKPDVPEIAETALNGTTTYTKGNELPGQNGDILTYPRTEAAETASGAVPTSVSEHPSAAQNALPEDVLVGPTPAFQASVLEVRMDLRNAIAEHAAKRTQSEDEAAIAPSARSQSTGMSDARSASMPDRVPLENGNEATRDAHAEQQAVEQTLSLSAVPAEAIDPESRYAGPAAVQPTPFDGGS